MSTIGSERQRSEINSIPLVHRTRLCIVDVAPKSFSPAFLAEKGDSERTSGTKAPTHSQRLSGTSKLVPYPVSLILRPSPHKQARFSAFEGERAFRQEEVSYGPAQFCFDKGLFA
jgi:hypothetical protein